jgi:1-acyl-sn-glycerol-3-phosphate acyltransferase
VREQGVDTLNDDDGHRALDGTLAALARLLVRVFFREVEVVGKVLVPHGRPLVLVANHENNLIDPLLVLACSGVRPRFLAKSTLWSHPLVAPLVLLAGALPVYRRQDAGADLKRNLDTFAASGVVLAHGGAVALFPEGTSHNERRRLPLKTGAARIVLEAQALRAAGVLVLPVGLTYDRKDRFRSRVLVRVGRTLDPAAEAATYHGDPRQAVRDLTARIAAALAEVTMDHGSWEETRRAARAAAPTADEAAPLAPVTRLEVRLPPVVTTLLAPIGIVGAALNWLPYRLPGWLSDRLAHTPDQPATYKLMAGLIAFPLAWMAEAAAAWRFWGPAGALALLALAPASGYVALLVSEVWKDARPDGNPSP